MTLRLGVNIDHVATLRNARGGRHPDPLRAAEEAAKAGADGITAHLREDRRHIRDDDIERLKQFIKLPLNLEMAATEEMTSIASGIRPHACCIVPERRQEITTEGGLDAAGQIAHLKAITHALSSTGIRVSLFIDANSKQIEAAKEIGAPVIELHTGAYADAFTEGGAAAAAPHLEAIRNAARLGADFDIEVHAGHGLDYRNVGPIAAIPEIKELNIGHFLVGDAVFIGLEAAIRKMRAAMNEARR